MIDFLTAPFVEFAFMRRALVASMALALGCGQLGPTYPDIGFETELDDGGVESTLRDDFGHEFIESAGYSRLGQRHFSKKHIVNDASRRIICVSVEELDRSF